MYAVHLTKEVFIIQTNQLTLFFSWSKLQGAVTEGQDNYFHHSKSMFHTGL